MYPRLFCRLKLRPVASPATVKNTNISLTAILVGSSLRHNVAVPVAYVYIYVYHLPPVVYNMANNSGKTGSQTLVPLTPDFNHHVFLLTKLLPKK